MKGGKGYPHTDDYQTIHLKIRFFLKQKYLFRFKIEFRNQNFRHQARCSLKLSRKKDQLEHRNRRVVVIRVTQIYLFPEPMIIFVCWAFISAQKKPKSESSRLGRHSHHQGFPTRSTHLQCFEPNWSHQAFSSWADPEK